MAAYVHDSNFFTRRTVVLFAIVGLHILIAWALATGLARRAIELVAPHPLASLEPDEEDFWDYECGFVDEHTVIASTGAPERAKHWMIDAAKGDVLGQVEYPVPVPISPAS